MSIYSKLLDVQRDLSVTGLAKNSRNEFQKYNYRGIDDLLNALSPLLCKHGVVIIPRITHREATQMETRKGDLNIHVSLAVTYELRCAETGEVAEVHAMGEGVDSLDKATNKAMTSAYKYAMIQLFSIPVVGTEDPDSGHGSEPSVANNEQAEKPAVEVRDSKRPRYTQKEFQEKLPVWKQYVEDGTHTPEYVLQYLEARADLTSDQRAAILRLEAKKNGVA